jgi:hypothetical protein
MSISARARCLDATRSRWRDGIGIIDDDVDLRADLSQRLFDRA